MAMSGTEMMISAVIKSLGIDKDALMSGIEDFQVGGKQLFERVARIEDKLDGILVLLQRQDGRLEGAATVLKNLEAVDTLDEPKFYIREFPVNGE